MFSFYSIREDDLIRLLADHYELNALISGKADNWDGYGECIHDDLNEWEKKLGIEDLTYEKVAQINLGQYSRPLPERAKAISAIDKDFWKEEWA